MCRADLQLQILQTHLMQPTCYEGAKSRKQDSKFVDGEIRVEKYLYTNDSTVPKMGQETSPLSHKIERNLVHKEIR